MRLALLGLIVFISYTIQAMTGFGSIILAITFGSFVYPIKTMLPVLVLLDLILNLYIVLRYGEIADFGLLLRNIFPLMTAGAVVGLSILHTYAGNSRFLLGLLVTLLAIFELVNFNKKSGKSSGRIRPEVANAFLFTSGIVEGMYASGGPLVVYVLNKLGIGKSIFRSTLASLWVFMDLFLMGGYLFIGIAGRETWMTTLYLLPVVVLSLKLGEFLHFHIDEKKFRIVVLYILLIGGISILLGR